MEATLGRLPDLTTATAAAVNIATIGLVTAIAPIAPFVVRWEFPLMAREENLDPAKLKRPKGGPEARYSMADILAVMGDGEWTAAELQKHVENECGMKGATFYRLWKCAKAEKQIHLSPISS
jgi:hypothetical protein